MKTIPGYDPLKPNKGKYRMSQGLPRQLVAWFFWGLRGLSLGFGVFGISGLEFRVWRSRFKVQA